MRRLRSLSLVAAIACSRTPPPVVPPVIEAKHVSTPAGVSFDEACTPRGPEICGNAIDDNCNGVIDEGCGIVVARVQFEVAWAEGSATVELVVGDPRGDKIDNGHRQTPSGLRLDRRCPQDGCDGQNVDNVVLTALEPVHGLYTVDVRLVDAGTGTLPLPVRFGWRVGDRVSSAAFSLGTVEDTRRFLFEL